MRVLQVVKTSDGAPWAAAQVSELVRAGVDVHVAVPSAEGLYMGSWRQSGAKMHVVPLNLPLRQPWLWPELRRRVQRLVDHVAPDIIHSHFVTTTLTLRYALGKNHSIPRVFQIPGPLHLESKFFAHLELSSAGANDYWIHTSKYIGELLRKAGIASDRMFFSYYGWDLTGARTQRTNVLRKMLSIPEHGFVVGNMSWLYPPKYHLGQTVGLKCHEDLIDALAIVTRKRRDVTGVLIGGAYSGAAWYEKRLKVRAQKAGNGRIKMPGAIAPDLVRSCWPDFDCAIHAPLSENCGGVMEPLLAGVPTIAANVGGLSEIVIEGVTGKLTPVRRPKVLADAVLEVLDDLERYRRLASHGRDLINRTFDVRRTAQEVFEYYQHLLSVMPARAASPEAAQPV